MNTNEQLVNKVEIVDNISKKCDNFTISVDINLQKPKLKKFN
jgi:hypothetical protein